jgi:hypothetical protein
MVPITPFDVSSLLGRSGGGEDFGYAQILNLFGEVVAEDPVAITQQVARSRVPTPLLAAAPSIQP